MKTRFAHITLSILAALVLSSCEKDVSTAPSDDEPNLIISLACPSQPDLKSAGSVLDPASDGEKAVNSVRLFFAKADASGNPAADTPVVEVTKSVTLDKTASKVEAAISGLSGRYHLLYVLANCPDGVTIDKSDYESFTGSCGHLARTVLDSFWNVTAGSFLMVNSVDLVPEGETSHEGGILIDMSQPVIETSVYLERVAAKVVADQSDLIDFQPYHTSVLGPDDDHGYVVSAAAITGWALFNCVNSFNLVQKYDGTNVVTPSSDASYPAVTKAALTSTGYYYTNPAPDQLSWKAPGDSLYCLENNPPYFPADAGRDPVPDTKMKGRVTAVIFRAQVKLADGFDAHADIVEPITVDPDPGVWVTRAGYQTNVEMTVYKYRNEYYASLDRLVEDFPDLEPYSSSAAGLRSQGVKVYENGYMYYTYWIADTGRTGTSAPYYSVERNKSYRLTVNYISDFGDDLPCGSAYDPEDPIDRAVPRINVDLTVTKWDRRTADYEIQ